MLLVLLLLIGCFPITASAKTKIADIEIDPITIIEGTFGDYDYNDGYFKYSPEDSLCYTVTFEGGEIYSDEGYSFEYNGEWYWFETETYQSLDSQWVSGNTYTMTVSLSGVSVEVPVTITDTPIESIEVEPISVIEYTNGEWQQEFNNESGKYERSYYYYDFSESIVGTINFADGTSTEFYDDFEYNGETYWVSASDNQSVQNPWTAGNEYSIQLEAMGVTENVPVTIEKSPVKSIELEPITIMEGTYGEWFEYNGEDCYIYDVSSALEYTVTFENGEVVSDYGNWVEYDGGFYSFMVLDNQSVDNLWKVGETYTATAELMGCSAQTEVYIENSIVESVEIEPIYIYEYTEGIMDGSYDFETDEIIDEYFYYEPESVMEYTVTFEDGEIVSGEGSNVEYNDEWYIFDVFTEQAYDNQWTAGNTYEMEVFLVGAKTVVEVTILECPIESIELEPIELIENTSGYYEYDYNEETDDFDLEYYYYYPDDYIDYTVTFKDGTVVSDVGAYVDYEENTYYFEVMTDQSYENAWTLGNTYNYTISLMNIEVEGEVTIVESPVKSIEFEPLFITEGTSGLYTWDYNYDTDEWDLFYYTYTPWDQMAYTVTFADGTVAEWMGTDFEYNGTWYSLEIVTDQAYDNQWTAGNTYTVTATVSGVTAYLDITITESVIESMEIKPVTVYEGINGYYVEEEDLNTGEWIEYFCYEPLYSLEYTVTLKDGTVIEGIGGGFEYDGVCYEISVIDDQSSENIWEIGNTYTAEALCAGKSFEFEVTVEGNVKGDVNCDGVANISDVTYIQKHLADLVELSYTEWIIADVDEDWEVTIEDATYLQKMLAGLI